MSVIDALVTDRTYEDVQLWQTLKALGWAGMSPTQQAQWSAGLKGAYNVTDLNRVNAAVEYLAGVFTSYGYTVSLQATPTWAIGEIPTEEQMGAYLSNVAALRAVINMPVATPAVPADMALLTYVEANNIEKILVCINELLEALGAAFMRSGMSWAYAGVGIYAVAPNVEWLLLCDSDGVELLDSDGVALLVR